MALMVLWIGGAVCAGLLGAYIWFVHALTEGIDDDD